MVSESFDVIAESQANPNENHNRHRFWGSVRMTYAICAFLAMALHLFMRSTLNLVVLCMTDDLSWSRSQAISLLGGFYVGYLITLPIAGRLADVFGGKHLFVQSVLVQALIFLLIPVFAKISYWAIIALSILQGLVSGFGSPSIYQLFATWAHPNERTALLSFAFSGYSVGSLLIFPISGFLCRFGWETAFYGIGLPCLICGISFNWLVYNTIDDHPRISRAEYEYLKQDNPNNVQRKIPWKSILTSSPIYAFVLTHVLHTYGMLLFSLMMPRFLYEAMEFTLTEVSIYSSASFLGSLISKIITVWIFSSIEKRANLNLSRLRRLIYIACNLATILLIIGIILLTSKYRIVIVLFTFCIGITTDFSFSAGYWPSLLFLAPSFAGLLSGFANSLATSSGFIVPIGVSYIITTGSKAEWNYVMCTLLISYGLGAIIYGCFGSSKLQSWNIETITRRNGNNK